MLAFAIWLVRSKEKTDSRTIALAAFLTAASFAVFQISIPVFGGVHLNLTPLIGILAGPMLGTIVVLITNLLSAAIGHGGWGLVGANVLINVTEVFVAYLVWKGLERLTGSLFARAGLATFTGLFAGNLVMMGIILVSGVQGTTLSIYQTFAGLTLVVAVNMGVAVIEALITGLVARYLGKTRPDLLGLKRQ